MALKAKKTRRERDDKDKAIEEVQKPVTKRLNVDIPLELHHKLKVHAMQCDKNMTDIVVTLLVKHLKRYSNE
ncbi:MAG: hypothetical protein ABG776_13865 [Cyanobacteria bacterium J06555_13]